MTGTDPTISAHAAQHTPDAPDAPDAPDPPHAPESADTPATPARRRWKTIGKPLLKLAVAAAILTALFTQIPFTDVAHALQQVNGWIAVAAFAMTMLMQLAVALRLKWLIDAHGVPLSIGSIYQINLATLFYGLFLPGGNFTGIAVRFYRLSREQQSALQTGVALFVDRIVATLTLLLVGIGFWLIEWPTGQIGALIFMLCGAAGLALLLAPVFGAGWLPGATLLRRMLAAMAGNKLAALRAAVSAQSALPRRKLVLVLVASLVVHLIGSAAYWMLAGAMGFSGLTFVTIAWVRATMILATMIPISVSGLGLREGATVFVLAQYSGIGEADAMAYSLLVFATTILAVGLVGGVLEGWRLLKK